MSTLRFGLTLVSLCLLAAEARGQFPAAMVSPKTIAANGGGLPHLATDGAGHWVAVWTSNDDMGNTIGSDFDILVSRTADNGLNWTTPAALNP